MIISVPTGTLMCSQPAQPKVRPVRVRPQVFVEVFRSFGIAAEIVRGFIPQYARRLFSARLILNVSLTGAFCACFRF